MQTPGMECMGRCDCLVGDMRITAPAYRRKPWSRKQPRPRRITCCAGHARNVGGPRRRWPIASEPPGPQCHALGAGHRLSQRLLCGAALSAFGKTASQLGLLQKPRTQTSSERLCSESVRTLSSGDQAETTGTVLTASILQQGHPSALLSQTSPDWAHE